MKIKYKKYTGNPGFIDFVSMVWNEMTDRADWRWFYLKGFENGEYNGVKLPDLKQPKDFDAKTIKSLLDVYDGLKEWKTKLEREENNAFTRFVKDHRKTGNNYDQKEIIRLYIKKIGAVSYSRQSKAYKDMYNTLRKRIEKLVNTGIIPKME